MRIEVSCVVHIDGLVMSLCSWCVYIYVYICMCMRQGWTAVMLAAYNGHVTCLQPLIDAKCDLNKADMWVTSSTNKALYAMYVCCVCVVAHRSFFG
jgi:hypothetical protein